MKPYPSHFSESNLQSLWKRRESALLPDEPRDDTVPGELQDEDPPIPGYDNPSGNLCALCIFVAAIAAVVALYFILR